MHRNNHQHQKVPPKPLLTTEAAASQLFERSRTDTRTVAHMGPEDPSNRKKYPSFFLKPNFRKLQDDSKNVCPKIGSTSSQK